MLLHVRACSYTHHGFRSQDDEGLNRHTSVIAERQLHCSQFTTHVSLVIFLVPQRATTSSCSLRMLLAVNTSLVNLCIAHSGFFAI